MSVVFLQRNILKAKAETQYVHNILLHVNHFEPQLLIY